MATPKFDLSTVSQAIDLISSAVADTHNALGENNTAAKVSDYGNLVPGILGLAAKAGALPPSLDQAPPAAAQAIANVVAAHPAVASRNVTDTTNGVLGLITSLFNVIISHSSDIAHLFKK